MHKMTCLPPYRFFNIGIVKENISKMETANLGAWKLGLCKIFTNVWEKFYMTAY